jgi:tetratricopeptide (TPR) repeat protein
MSKLAAESETCTGSRQYTGPVTNKQARNLRSHVMDALRQGRPSEAEAAASAVVAARPDGTPIGEPHMTAWELWAASLDYLGQHTRAAEEFVALADSAASVYGNADSRVMRYGLSYAAELVYLGQYEEAEGAFSAAIRQSARVRYQSRSIIRLTATKGLVSILNIRGAHAEAESLARSAINQIPRVAKWRPRFVVAFHADIANSLNGRERYSEAELAVRALKPTYVPDIIAVLWALGTAQLGLGRAADAEEIARNAVLTGERGLSAAHYLTLQSGTLLGMTLARQGKLDDAESQLRSNADAWLEHFGRDHPKTVAAQQALAGVCEEPPG